MKPLKKILSYKKPAFLIGVFALVSILIIAFAVLSNPINSSYAISKEMNDQLNWTRDQYNRVYRSYSPDVFGEKSREIVKVDGVKIVRQVLDNGEFSLTFSYSMEGAPLSIDFKNYGKNQVLYFALRAIYYGKLNSWPFPESDAKRANDAYGTAYDNTTWTIGTDVVVTCLEPHVHYVIEWKNKYNEPYI